MDAFHRIGTGVIAEISTGYSADVAGLFDLCALAFEMNNASAL